MKKLLYMSMLAISLLLVGCDTDEKKDPNDNNNVVDVVEESHDNIFIYEHVDGLKDKKDENGYVIWEYQMLGYVKYQVAFTSCTCRDTSINHKTLLYVEVKDDGTIQKIEYNYYGDSEEIYGSDFGRQDIIDDYVPQLIDKSATEIADVSTDTWSGATVTTENLKTLLVALIDYHNENYVD